MAEFEIDYLKNNNNDAEIEINGVKQRAIVTVNPKDSAPSINKSSLALFRPASDNGLPTGNLNMIGDYSATNKEFYVEALEGERLAVKRAIAHIYVDANDIDPGTYGNVPELTNGILIFLERQGVIFNVLDGLPLKKQEDWGRICYDAQPVGPYGTQARTPFFQVRLTFTKFADSKYGIILEEGERLGVRLRDDFTNGGANPLTEHYIYFEGEHIGTPNTAWQNPIAPL